MKHAKHVLPGNFLAMILIACFKVLKIILLILLILIISFIIILIANALLTAKMVVAHDPI